MLRISRQRDWNPYQMVDSVIGSIVAKIDSFLIVVVGMYYGRLSRLSGALGYFRRSARNGGIPTIANAVCA